MFSCEYCKIFKNIYFEEHLRMAISEVRIKQKRNLKKQVFCKTDVLKYLLKATGWHLYWSVSFNDVTRFETTNTKAWKLCMICINWFSTSKMAEGAKQDVHLWKETVLFYLIMDLQQGN